MTDTLSPRQRDILAVITRSVEQSGQAPALAAIGAALGGITSPSVYKHILALEQKGYIRRHPNRRPPIELLLPLPATGETRLPVLVRVAGRLQAGQPLTITNGDETSIAVDREVLRGSDGAVALRVDGFGWSSEGILDGDIIIVHPGRETQPGATIIALLDGGGATVRRYLPDELGTSLVSAQPGGESLRVRDVTIYGTVLALRRRYG